MVQASQRKVVAQEVAADRRRTRLATPGARSASASSAPAPGPSAYTGARINTNTALQQARIKHLVQTPGAALVPGHES